MNAMSPLLAVALYSISAVPVAHAQSPDSCRAERWVQLYTGGPYRPHYPVDSLTPYVAVVDRQGRPTSWLTTGVIVVEFRAPGGAMVGWNPKGPEMIGADWEQLLDSIFEGRGVIARLDTVVGRVTAVLGPRNRPYAVAFVVPYPDVRRGPFNFGGRRFDLSTLAGRLGVVDAYVGELIRRFDAAHYEHLRLTGIYWLNEAIRPEDLTVMPQFARQIQEHHLQLMWNPDFFDFTHKHWQNVWSLGFDRVFLQEDYFIDTTASVARLDSAIALARSQRVGVDVEFDKRLFSRSPFARRLEPSLTALDSARDLRAGPMMLYEGGGALARLATSSDSNLENLYAHLASTFRVPEMDPECR